MTLHDEVMEIFAQAQEKRGVKDIREDIDDEGYWGMVVRAVEDSR